MALSPFDVEHKTFRTALRGYAEEEVDAFLDDVVSSLREYEQNLKEATEQVAVLESEMVASREAEAAIRRTFIAAQRTADQMIEEARVEAKRLVAEARSEAADYEAERAGERKKARSEVEAMHQAVEDLRDRLRNFSEGALDQTGGIEAAIQDVVASYDLGEEERTYEIPALVAAEEDDEFEYYEEEEEPVSPPMEEQPVVDEASAEEKGEEQPDETVAVDLEEEAVAQRARPRRPWERQASDG